MSLKALHLPSSPQQRQARYCIITATYAVGVLRRPWQFHELCTKTV